MTDILVNGKTYSIDADSDTPLLWVLRDEIGLTGTKFGCGKGLCGACTVHIDGRAARACVTPLANVAGKAITTIEGLSQDGVSHPVQAAWIAEEVPQCGYCQSGQIMAAAAFLQQTPDPDSTQIRQGINNLCRCGTYLRIAKAIARAAEKQGASA